jgi:hypothetical protein
VQSNVDDVGREIVNIGRYIDADDPGFGDEMSTEVTDIGPPMDPDQI